MSDHRAPQRASLIGRPSRRLLAALTVLLVVAGTTWFSGATFLAGSTTGATVNAAADYHPPTVALASPGTTVSGTVAVSATASDTGSGVAQVVVQYAAAGSTTWTTVCTRTASPYSCSWNTLTLADGDYQLRAIATDNVGTTATSATVTTKVNNPAAVTLTRVPDVVRGNLALSATVSGANGRTVTSTFSHRVDGNADYTPISSCTGVSGTTPSCTWATGTLADLYDIKVTSTVGTLTVSAEQFDVIVDNLPPTITVVAPSAASGTILVTATPADEDSGVAKVDLSYRPTGGTWVPLCTTTATPWRCALDTTKLTNGGYEVRGAATDVAGNTTTSTAVTITVNNGAASVTITSPVAGELVRAAELITTDFAVPTGSTATSVRIEARPTSPNNAAWVAVCTDTTAPFTCDWATTSLASGTWELRAVLAYSGTNSGTFTSPTVTVTVDNNPLRALDVQATNGGVLGRPDAGDTLVLTYAGNVNLSSIRSGWTSGSTTSTVVFADKAFKPVSATDRVNLGTLGTVLLPQNYVRKNRSVTLNVTLTATNGTSGGLTTTVITVTLGTVAAGSGGDLVSSATAGTMTWTPSASVTNQSGVACSTTAAVETGASDRDL